MGRLLDLAAGLSLLLATTGVAHAVFSAAVPEPETMVLLVAGLAAAGGVRHLIVRRRRRSRDRRGQERR